MWAIPDGPPIVDLELRVGAPWNPLQVFLTRKGGEETFKTFNWAEKSVRVRILAKHVRRLKGYVRMHSRASRFGAHRYE